ncbi:MAG: bifunctional hydroxymethylpyrimidine kinase/phosphomethylpyrimidine kinase [bacterium]
MQSSQVRALTIAGSDSGGGAGIQADLKTFTLLGVFGLSAITALTVQNTLGVHRVMGVPEDFVQQQMVSVLEDIGANAIKTGMLFSQGIVEVVADTLQGKGLPLVIDPVLAAKRGETLLAPEAVPTLKNRLFPLASLVTPNIPEAEVLSGLSPLQSMEQIKNAAKEMVNRWGASSVLIKGGHLSGQRQIFDLFFNGAEFVVFEKERLSNQHTHGVGCTLAAAITAYLAHGLEPIQAVQEAQAFIKEAIQSSLPLGQGIGPVNVRVSSSRGEPQEKKA